MDDPRLSGRYETNQNADQYLATVAIKSGVGSLTNEGGSWAVEFHGCFVIESDHEMPGRMPGFLKDLVTGVITSRQHRKIPAGVKALAEASVLAHA